MSITIQKGKLLKEAVVIEYKRLAPKETKPAKCSFEHDAPPHSELKTAFEALNVHAALIGEFIPAASVNSLDKVSPEQIKDFNVTGFSLSGKDDDAVILSANKTLHSGKVLGFNTPLIRFRDESETKYPFMDELTLSLDACKYELEQYLNGKHAPDNQGKLFDEDLEEGETNNAKENERIKNGVPGAAQKRKKKQTGEAEV